MLKCVVIYNPNSGKLTNRNEIKRLYKLLENYGYDTQIIYTEYKGHAKELVKKMDDVDLLLCAGGDGTLNEVISGNIERHKPILLGHLPLGSVNDVAHMYGMTNNTIKNNNIPLCFNSIIVWNFFKISFTSLASRVISCRKSIPVELWTLSNKLWD